VYKRQGYTFAYTGPDFSGAFTFAHTFTDQYEYSGSHKADGTYRI